LALAVKMAKISLTFALFLGKNQADFKNAFGGI
jgi:hypothetical protein